MPTTIWMQFNSHSYEGVKGTEDATWCEDQINDDDTAYVRKSWSDAIIRLQKSRIKKLIAEYEMKLENAQRYGHGDELIYEDMIKNLKELVG